MQTHGHVYTKNAAGMWRELRSREEKQNYKQSNIPVARDCFSVAQYKQKQMEK